MRSERMGGGKGGGLPPALGGSVRTRPRGKTIDLNMEFLALPGKL